MLARVTAVEYMRPMSQGRTSPALIVCEKHDGTLVEVVAKFSAECDQGVTNLVREAVAVCLARDLGLPIPEAFLVEVPKAWVDTIPNAGQQSKIEASVPVAFGSRMITGQYSAWSENTPISEAMVDTAASILAFDGIIQNPDRRVANPNCIVRGENIRIFDHELCFSQEVVIGWQPPWVLGGLKAFETAGFHIFRAGLRHAMIGYDAIEQAWLSVSPQKIAGYMLTVPSEWSEGSPSAEAAIRLIVEARENIQGCIAEMKRVLT